MAADLILTAASIITMDPAAPRAEAIAVDTTSGTIAALGSLADVQAAAPSATVQDLGSTVLMPGFIDAHNHPVLSGIASMPPAYWIAPNVGYPTWAHVEAAFAKADKEAPAGQPVLFNGLDRLLQEAPEPTRTMLDGYFPSGRAVCIIDNSGHAVYFNTPVTEMLGWKAAQAPADPVGGRWGREADGHTSNGVGYESSTVFLVGPTVMMKAVPHPLHSAAQWYQHLAQGGITATSEHSYSEGQKRAYVALASAPDCPLRLHAYHMSTEKDAGEKVAFPDEAMLRKNGIKLWADGSPWVGNIAISFQYLDNATTQAAQIPTTPRGEGQMNYTREELDGVLDQIAGLGWQIAFHCNGDVGFDVVLDAYEAALTKHGLLGTDHRWRVEHLGAARADQFERAASLGVVCSLSPFQFIYWGDLLDGVMFESSIGSQWQRLHDAFEADVHPSFHSDGSVSPPEPLMWVQRTVTRTTDIGNVHGANQAVTLDQALQAITVNAAYALKREHEIGSIAVGKLADLVELSTDPYSVSADQIIDSVKVNGTWVGGRRVDTGAFLAQVDAIDPTQHADLHEHAVKGKRCC